jgi:LPXTG-motif cell wall-anchored protein
MRMTKRLVCLLAALLIAVPVVAIPATALGQSAGDDQYVDPFQGNGNGNGNGNSGSGSQSNNDTSASQQTNQTTTTPGNAAQDPSANGTLPRTGEDLGGIALMGVVLIGGGFALRRAWPLPE